MSKKTPLFTIVYNTKSTDGYISLVKEFFDFEDHAWLRAAELKLSQDLNVLVREYSDEDNLVMITHDSEL